MPRIDPLSLLKCLSVLLGPTGGIKSTEEVNRLASLMTKFSKKLVSKCIYIQILKTTNTDLLNQFMRAGGWNLIHTWLTDGILAKNWALIKELLELLLICPVDIERLKSNNCPKLIKGLSKEGSHQGVRMLASRLVEQWLKIVKGEAAPNSVPTQIMTVSVQSNTTPSNAIVLSSQQHYSVNAQQIVEATDAATIQVQDLKLAQQCTANALVNQSQQDQEKQQQPQERLQLQTVQLQVVGKAQQVQLQQQTAQQQYTTLSVKQEVKQKADIEEVGRSDSAISGKDYTIEIGQLNDSEHISSEVKQTVISSKDSQDAEGVKIKDNKDSRDIVTSDNSKSNDKENRDSHTKDEKKSGSSVDKKSNNYHHSSSSSSKSSKHSTSSSTHRSSSNSHKSSSHRSNSNSSSSTNSKSSSKDRSSKDKHHSSLSSKHSSSKTKSERDREREKEREKQKKDQAEKDKATLEKVQGQALSSKLGKIPKKRIEDEKLGDTSGRRPSTESKDGSKENKEKTDSKKDTLTTKIEKKNISISIENRKNTQDSMIRPKTVKTFNSKFRSTGLEEEVKLPPPRSKKSNTVVDKKVLPPKFPLKRSSPLRETIPLIEKRAKLSLDLPTTITVDEKKGGIKLIPPKPKPMVLQESDMFMDALTASTKSKEPRKRKRRTSLTKDGSTEAKKQEIITNDNRESTPPPSSPSNVEERSAIALKPNFKFYQDTLVIDEEKNQTEKENSEEDLKKDKDQVFDDEKDNRDDDDIGNNTPTLEDVEDTKDSESPEDTSSIVSDSLKKDNVGSYSEIRYIDGLRSVLLLQKRKGPKKVLKWKTDLESIRYFELDETERVNVTKTFTDMKQMEKQNEREAFQMARKLNNEDLMEERTRWKSLIPIDLPPLIIEPGKDSKEKDIQYAREKGILQALYFNRSMIPDSAAEPGEERHHIITEPKIIPLDDLTGSKETEKDLTLIQWPEPKPQLTPQPPSVTTFHYPTTFPHNQQSMMTPMGPQPTMNPMPQMPQQMMGPAHMASITQQMAGPSGGGGWRTGDGKVLVPDVGMNPMANMPGRFNQGLEGAPMVPPGMMGPPPMYNQQEGYGMMCPEDMGFNNMNPNNFQGPPMYGPGPNFPGPRGAPPMHNRGRGGPGWRYRGGGPNRGGGWRGGGGGWRGSGKQPPVCRQFSKNGYCQVGDKCQYLHPGVNCPPF
ncbi:hypothetical protein HN011_002524 [Eciton burchellii]|nr:hypothetical protein HN011_002524 [Eciton burchellii]